MGLETKETSDCYDLWMHIKNKIHPATQLTISDIRENLMNIKFAGSSEEYINAIRTQVEVLKTLGKPMDDEEHFHYLRRGLPERFDNLRMAIVAKTMTPDELADLIREEDAQEQDSLLIRLLKPIFLKRKKSIGKEILKSQIKAETLKKWVWRT